MTPPPLRLYVISTQFADGIGGLSFAFGFTESMGVGQAVQRAIMAEPSPKGPLVNIMVQEISAAQLRETLRTLETGVPGDERAVPLRVVGPAPEPVTEALAADTGHRSDVRPVEDGA